MRKLIDALAIISFLMSAGLSAGAVFLYMKLPSLISNAVINLTVEMIPEAPIKGLPVGGDDGIKDSIPGVKDFPFGK